MNLVASAIHNGTNRAGAAPRIPLVVPGEVGGGQPGYATTLEDTDTPRDTDNHVEVTFQELATSDPEVETAETSAVAELVDRETGAAGADHGTGAAGAGNAVIDPGAAAGRGAGTYALYVR